MRKSVLTVASLIVLGIVFMAFQDNTLKESMKRGEEVYTTYCVTCHMQNGEGMEGAFPPLARADFLSKDKNGKRSIGAILNGMTGEMKVNGQTYNVVMPPQSYLTDQQIADVLNFVRNSWGNKGSLIKEETVKAERK